MLKKTTIGLMLTNNRVFAAVSIVLLKNQVCYTNKLLLANLYTNLVQSSDILDQRSLLHLGQPVVYWLFACLSPYALKPSTDVLTVNSVYAGYDSDDNALPSVSFSLYLCGSPLRKFIQNPI
jgi:hypothetical protein